MPLPTVASLCSVLGKHLAPLEGFEARDTEVTAVHISELRDPNAYLSGGELLLTTGMALPSSAIGCRRYVTRLTATGISALALGVGPVHKEPPELLVKACRDADLTLLIVPAPTPFLMVSRAYWMARSRSTERELHDAVAAHRALVDAAAAADPAAAILRRLARHLEGWTALLSASGDIDHVFPAAVTDEVEVLRAEVARLELAGVHSSASLTIGGLVVVVLPLAVENRIVGYLAAGSPRQLEPPQRRVVLTAGALLSLDALRNQRVESARDAARRCVALLVDAGLIDAARRLAADTASPTPTREVRIVVARGRDSDGLVREVERCFPEALAVAVDRSTAWFILPDGADALVELADRLRALDPLVVAAVSDLVGVALAGPTRARLARGLGAMSDGTVALPRTAGADGLRAVLDAFLAVAKDEVRESLVAYLRHRGQWEQAAQATNVHRNTLRYRVQRARELLGLDLEDPDIAAEVWLMLRARGLA